MLHGGNIKEHQRLPEMVVRAKAADSAGRDAHNRAWFSIPRVFPIGTGTHVDSVLKHSGNGTIVLRCDEQDAVKLLQTFTEFGPGSRRVVVKVLIVKREPSDLDNFETERIRRKF